MLSKIIAYRYLLIFVFIHILVFNINAGEWGDSYRILRASEYLRKFSYPQDEKRQPLYSLILAIRPSGMDQVFWGRVEMFFISSLAFFVFSSLLKEFRLNKRATEIATILFIFNPILLYWSIRIMADLLFCLIVLLVFLMLIKNKARLSIIHYFSVGLLSGLAYLIRYEGAILGFTVFMPLLARGGKSVLKKAKLEAIRKVSYLGVSFILGVFIIILPWLVYRNPFESKYFSEPEGRTYDLKMVIIYLVSLLYLLGFTSGFSFILKVRNYLRSFFSDFPELTLFVILELLLVLVWPAAVPRLFLPVIPFLIIFVSKYFGDYFSDVSKLTANQIILPISLLIIFPLAQYFLKLQFLILLKHYLLVVIILQLANIVFLYKKYYQGFLITLFLSTSVWSFSTIILHKDIFLTVIEANKYIVNNLTGRVVYNDVSSVSDWYLNQKSHKQSLSGVYKDMDNKKGRAYGALAEKHADYVMITNEHNTDLKLDPASYLTEIKEFKHTIRGKEFFAKIYKFERDNL